MKMALGETCRGSGICGSICLGLEEHPKWCSHFVYFSKLSVCIQSWCVIQRPKGLRLNSVLTTFLYLNWLWSAWAFLRSKYVLTCISSFWSCWLNCLYGKGVKLENFSHLWLAIFETAISFCLESSCSLRWKYWHEPQAVSTLLTLRVIAERHTLPWHLEGGQIEWLTLPYTERGSRSVSAPGQAVAATPHPSATPHTSSPDQSLWLPLPVPGRAASR